MKSPYTTRQGEFLAFIHHYTTLHGRPPAEAEMVNFFRVTPPTVHQMILTLERRGLIRRTPGEARSIRLKLAAEELPSLHGSAKGAEIHPPMRQAEGQTPADEPAALVHFGRMQIEDLFAYNNQNPLDDSDFIPLLDVLIESFTRAGLSALAVKGLRRHACEIYHRSCQESALESTFESNIELMFSYLPGPAGTQRQRWL